MTPRTYSHNHQKSRHEPSQLHNAAASIVHKIILRLGFAAEPVGHGSDHVGCDHEEGEVVLEQGRGQDDKEEADREDLWDVLDCNLLELSRRGTYEGEDDYGLEARHGQALRRVAKVWRSGLDGLDGGIDGIGLC